MKQKMTKLFCLLAAFTLTISMTACGNPGSESQTDPAADDGTVDLTIGLTSLGSETLDYSIPSGYTNENISRLLYTDYIVSMIPPWERRSPGATTRTPRNGRSRSNRESCGMMGLR